MGDATDIVALGSMAPGAIVFPSMSSDAEKNAPLDVVDFESCCLDWIGILLDRTRVQSIYLPFMQN
jgi:hypothetical protein